MQTGPINLSRYITYGVKKLNQFHTRATKKKKKREEKEKLLAAKISDAEDWNKQLKPGPSCSKLTTSLVNDSLKFKSSDTRIC